MGNNGEGLGETFRYRGREILTLKFDTPTWPFLKIDM